MFVPNETLLCLHAEDGKASIVFSLENESYDPAVGSVDQIREHHYRVIRRAEVESFDNGHSYWVVHALKIAQSYH